MKTLLLTFAMLLCPMLSRGQELPDAPSPQPKLSDYEVHNSPSPAPKSPGFFAFRKSWQDPPLRTNKQMFKSKLFLLSMAGGDIAMIVACRNPRSGESWHSEVPAAIGVNAMAYLGGRFFTQSFAVAPGIYQMIHYSTSAAK